MTSIVHTVGPDVVRLMPGDHVLVPNFAGVQMFVEKFCFAVVKEEDVLAVVLLPDASGAKPDDENYDDVDVLKRVREAEDDPK